MWEISANLCLPKALKSWLKSNKSPNLVTLLVSAQLSNKFGYCPSCTVSFVLQFQLSTWADTSLLHLLLLPTKELHSLMILKYSCRVVPTRKLQLWALNFWLVNYNCRMFIRSVIREEKTERVCVDVNLSLALSVRRLKNWFLRHIGQNI